MAVAQDSDVELRSLLESGSGLELKQLQLPSSQRLFYCDISTGKVRPYVPETFRRKVFEMLHGLSHPGVKATTNLIKQRFVWKSVNKDVQEWCKFCIACQKSKIHRDTKSPLGLFQLPNTRFNHVHIDVVGPLPASKGYNFVLTCIYRFSRWPEAFPMCNQTAETVAQALYTGWISRFGVPEIITSDRGTNFESNLFQALSEFLGATKTRTTSFHPAANGIVERMHRQLKTALKCYTNSSWLEVLPTVLLGMRACLKEDIGASPAEMVYGQCLRLPGEFFRNITSSRQMLSEDTFLQRLRLYTRRLRPVPTSHHSSSTFFVHPDLRTSSYVFVRCDTVRKPLEQPYQGPFKVISRNDKFFKININKRQSTVSIDRLKPAYVLPDVLSENLFSKTEESKCKKVSTQPVTRSGRRVRLVEPYQAS
ncbi:Retrovirus-related Pol polyprotein from transposon 412 [Araneus ventricosus]|uniref:Retrovirus-related Pol polyprotein from transposon 412 n=1 Tax=Araneus ventricosus TaxID=182803 RepID=A0A4Y2HRF4_ARAVE|nr:Retrovirus-related Pol polyprotein from transposon 412 [Araneus ventricosus]